MANVLDAARRHKSTLLGVGVAYLFGGYVDTVPALLKLNAGDQLVAVGTNVLAAALLLGFGRESEFTTGAAGVFLARGLCKLFPSICKG